jgi:hypothetical protein
MRLSTPVVARWWHRFGSDSPSGLPVAALVIGSPFDEIFGDGRARHAADRKSHTVGG